MYHLSTEFTGQEQHALSKLVGKGWVREFKDIQDDAIPIGSAWQLTKAPLESIQVNMTLHFPFSVFTRRQNISLDHATTFELMLTLKSAGWQEQSAKGVKNKKAVPPFIPGYLDIFSGGFRSWRLATMPLPWNCPAAQLHLHTSYSYSLISECVYQIELAPP